jgi:ABC-type multidrug transport system ATPase subunit/pSer/pThr/pTyr-binding forkhead associated (FHA) protein
MPPEHSDWPGQQPPQAGSISPGPAAFAPAGLAEAAPPQGPSPQGASPQAGPGTAAPALVVRTRRSDHTLQAGTTYRIGRDPKSDIVVADSRVSWRHGVLRNDGDGWVLEDVGSTNGTFLGLQRVDRIPVSGDCVVRLGNSEDGPVLRCILQPAAAAAPAAPAAPAVLRDAPAAPAAFRDAPAAPIRRDAPDSAAPRTPPAAARPVTPVVPMEPVRPAEPAALRDASAAAAPAPAPAAPPRPAAPPAYQPPQPSGYQPPKPPPYQPPAQQAAAAPEALPSVDIRPTARMPLPAKAMRIGRVPDNDLVLSDLDVSRHHAELRKSPGGTYEIVDLGSHNGTYVNGRRVSSAVLSDEDIVSIGHSTFRLVGGELRQFVDDGLVTFSAQDLVVRVSGGKVLLDRVTFPIPEKCLLGVIGPSGAGKSTLLGALTGMRPADTGTVLYDNRDLYQHYAELRYRIGLVPQESVLHTQLTARRALQYSAELRFPADTEASERDARVDEVMSELGLSKHANTRADRLSGGQLKRVNVAQELLTKPSLLFLDEPTSGLDPGLDKSVMEQMRDLAHDGRTVIVVTHSVAHLDACDRLLVLVPGGKVAYYGPPDEGLNYFGLTGWAEVFQAFERYPDRDWAAEYAASPAHAQYVLGQRPKHEPGAQGDDIAGTAPQPSGGLRQFRTLTRRYVRVIASDRGYLIFMGLLPIILGGLIYYVGNSLGLQGLQAPGYNPKGTLQPNGSIVLLMLTICACLAGSALSIRELVKERAIYTRERAAGLSSGAYLSSKLLVLGVISIVQSLILVLLGVALWPLPKTGSFLTHAPLAELLIGIAVLSLTSMCLGLLISALVSTSEKAMPFLVLAVMFQVILSGGVPVGLYFPVTAIAPARWGFGAVASTSDLNNTSPIQAGKPDALWFHTSSQWLTDMGVMIGLGLLFVLLTWFFVHRLGPRRRKG